MVETREEIVNELPKGLVKWLDLDSEKSLLIIEGGQKDEILYEAFLEMGVSTDKILYGELLSSAHAAEKEQYDYIVITSAIERAKSPERILELASSLLAKKGKMYIATENRLGVSYFCGDRDPYTGRNFDGIEDYRRVSSMDYERLGGRLYSKRELVELLETAGFTYHHFFSVFPQLDAPQIIFSEDYEPTEELGTRIFPQYHNPDTIFLEEEVLYTELIKNGLFHTMANGFLIECMQEENEEKSKIEQVTVSVSRGRKDAFATLIMNDKRVLKKPIYQEGRNKLEALCDNESYLKRHGVPMVHGEKEANAYVMPFVKGEALISYFRKLAEADKEAFYKEFDELWEMILCSSEHVVYEDVDWEHFDPRMDLKEKQLKREIDRSEWRKVASQSGAGEQCFGPILRRGYIDLVLINGFMTDGGMVFYDQETYVKELPARAIMLRNIELLYMRNPNMERVIPIQKLYERYQIEPYLELYVAMSHCFLMKLRKDDVLLPYYNVHRKNPEIVHSNRQRMNYSVEEYQRLFIDIFKNVKNKKIYLFGSGNFTKKFLALYGDEYEIAGILDNNETKWGSEMDGIPILSPSALSDLDSTTYKVIICIKNYTGVLAQVKRLGVTNIGVYDTNMEYPRKAKTVVSEVTEQSAEPKKYHVGYVAGVFDLFHMGHLNLLHRAKEQCDYLIVGVVTDEGVRKNKKTEAFVPFEERLAIVQSCRYVDEAVGIPMEFADTKDAYRKFQFDAQFSGSDYSGDPVWEEKREFLREHGAELVFFPYTESTSSTKLKALINQKLNR